MPRVQQTSRHSYASKSQDPTVQSVHSRPTLPMGSGRYQTKCSDEIVIVRSLKFSSDPCGESRETWFVFSFFCRVMYILFAFHCCLQCSNFFCGVSVVSAFVFLVDTMFVRSRWHFSFSRCSFLLRFGLYC